MVFNRFGYLLWALVAVLGTIQLSCQRRADFNYAVPDARFVSKEHKLKEMHGTNDVDILWVIDNSSSMGGHQATVIANIDQFMSGLEKDNKLHWKTGLISTDESQNPFEGFNLANELDYRTPNAAGRFAQAVRRLGLNGSTTEMTFDPVAKALYNNPKFIRPGAYLAIIVISDAPEQSRMSTADFVSILSNVKGDLSKVLFYGFLFPSEWCSPSADTVWAWAGSKFEALLKSVKGSAFKLCDPLFGRNLASLGQNLAQVVTTPRIYLEQRPVVKSLKVLRGTTEVPGGNGGYWQYDYMANAIVFTDLAFAPGDNESVRVVYDIDDGIER